MPLLAAIRSRLGRAGALYLSAALAGGLSLGLPWRSAADAVYLPGWYMPGSCATVYDLDGWPSLECTSGSMGFDTLIRAAGAAGGKELAVRVLLAAVVVLVVLARRRRAAGLATGTVVTAAVGLALAGLALGGLLPRTGQLAYLAGFALLVLALRADALWPWRSRAAAAGQPSAETTSPTT